MTDEERLEHAEALPEGTRYVRCGQCAGLAVARPTDSYVACPCGATHVDPVQDGKGRAPTARIIGDGWTQVQPSSTELAEALEAVRRAGRLVEQRRQTGAAGQAGS